jgi:Na+/H+ antiporter NhaB
MRHITTTISGHPGTHDVAVAVFWIFAGIIIVIVFGDALTVLAVVIAISWIYRKVEHRLERSQAEMAPVTHLRPELTGQRDSENTSAHASRRFHRAA